MRKVEEILAEYDREKRKYDSVEKTDQYISRINYLIKNDIRELRPCYPGTDKYDHAEIYPSEVDNEEWEPKKRFDALYELWHDAPYDYQISKDDQVRINSILKNNFTLEEFKEVIANTEKVEKEWYDIQESLLNEYATLEGKDMEDLLEGYIDARGAFRNYDEHPNDHLHPLLYRFVDERCKITLTQL